MLKHNIIRYKLIEKHIELVKAGNYQVARKLLRLLRDKRLSVGLDDIGCAVELIAEDLGCHIRYSRTYYTAHISY